LRSLRTDRDLAVGRTHRFRSRFNLSPMCRCIRSWTRSTKWIPS